MGRSRYTITEADKPQTYTIVEWLPVFTRPETVQILLDYWQYKRQHADLKLYSYEVTACEDAGASTDAFQRWSVGTIKILINGTTIK